MNWKGFAFEAGDGGKHINTLCLWCSLSGFSRAFFRKPTDVPADYIPYGNVQWVEGVLGRNLVPDYFPAFLADRVYRKIWRAEKWPIGQRVHIKPSDRYKRFTGFVTNGTWKGKKRGPYWCSEPVVFVNEWRYYVANGAILAAHWYWGDEVNTPAAPELGVSWPNDFCGAADFGERPDGRIELIESHHAIACGWYGSMNDGETFAKWLDAGWASVKQAQPTV